MQCVRSSSEKFDHCLTSCSRTARSLSMQFFCSCGMAGSWKVTPPCCAIPLHTGTTLRSGTRSPLATSVMNCTPKAIAFGKIMTHSAQPSPPLMLRLQQSTQAKYYLQSSWRRHKELLANQSDFVPIRTTVPGAAPVRTEPSQNILMPQMSAHKSGLSRLVVQATLITTLQDTAQAYSKRTLGHSRHTRTFGNTTRVWRDARRAAGNANRVTL